jgi:hypothetical protein
MAARLWSEGGVGLRLSNSRGGEAAHGGFLHSRGEPIRAKRLPCDETRFRRSEVSRRPKSEEQDMS